MTADRGSEPEPTEAVPTPRSRPPRLLTIAGSDSGGGAGIQADLKTFAALGGFGMTAITAVTAQNTIGVFDVHELPPASVAAQIDAVFEDVGVDAVKIGMLSSAPIVEAVANRLRSWRDRGQRPPIVLDPVMVAKGGARLISEQAVDLLIGELLPLATLVTPNLPEAERLTSKPVTTIDERIEAGRSLASESVAALIKGGHAEGETMVDHLVRVVNGEIEIESFRHPRIETRATHGTGCTLSSAIAAHLGAGLGLVSAVDRSIDYLHGAIRNAFQIGATQSGMGSGPVNHLWRGVEEPVP